MAEFLLILGAIVIYFAPLLVAAWRRHPKLVYIGGLNAALGITGIGWIGALVWALRRRKVVAMSYHGDMQVPRSFNTGLLAAAGLMVGVALVATVGINRLQGRRTDQAAAALYVASATTAAPQWRHAVAGGADTVSLQSTNSLVPPAPFKAGPATLSVISRDGGDAVSLDLDGELACSYAPAANSVEVSFDGGPAQAFACAPAPAGLRQLLFDGDHSTAYLADAQGFLARLKGARHVSVTAGFADTSAPQSMTFDLPPGEAIPEAAVASVAAPGSAEAADKASAADGDPAGKGDHGRHGRRRHHVHRGDATYVDGISTPASGDDRGHGRRRHHHAGA